MVRFLHQCFLRCPETCADENAIGAEHQCGGETASVGNAPRRKEHVLHILTLANHDRAGATNGVHEGSRVAEGQHHCCWTMFQRVRQEGWGLAQGPCYEADADVLVAGRIELIFEPGRVPVSTANQAQAASAADGRSQRAASSR